MIDDDGHDALTRLNSHRRTVKHHGGVVPAADEDATKADLWRAASALDWLQGHLDRIGPQGPRNDVRPLRSSRDRR